MAYQIRLPFFEGPLDLLLHLIKRNEVDIYDIPIAQILDQYLDTLEMMRQLNLDIAGGFLLMAATLAHIKSKMLLPPSEEEEEEEEDPRAELMAQLIEYQRYKEVAEQLRGREILNRDVFARKFAPEEALRVMEEGALIDVGLFDLVDAFRQMVESRPKETYQEIEGEEYSVEEKVEQILSALRDSPRIAFMDLFSPRASNREIITIFLGLLELMRVRVIRCAQAEPFGPILVIRTGVLMSPFARPEIVRGDTVES